MAWWWFDEEAMLMSFIGPSNQHVWCVLHYHCFMYSPFFFLLPIWLASTFSCPLKLTYYHCLFSVPMQIFIVWNLYTVWKFWIKTVSPIQESDCTVANKGLRPICLFKQAHLLLNVVMAQVKFICDCILSSIITHKPFYSLFIIQQEEWLANLAYSIILTIWKICCQKNKFAPVQSKDRLSHQLTRFVWVEL